MIENEYLATNRNNLLTYLPHNQINKQKWDACVESSAQRLVYALSWYLDVVAPGWAALVLEQDNTYQAVMPLPEARQFGIRFVFQPFFCPQLGVFSASTIDLNLFLKDLSKRYSFVRNYCFNTTNTCPSITAPAVPLNVYYTHHLDLAPGYAHIYTHYTRDRKLNLKRAHKAGVTLVESTDIKPLICLFREDAESRIYGGVNPETYVMLECLYEQLHNRGLATLLYTRTKTGEIDAGGLFITYAHKIIYIFNAASKAGRPHNGRSFLIDAIIQKYAGQPYVFDFESPPAVPNVIRVYQGFGSKKMPYYALYFNQLPWPVKLIKEWRQHFYLKIRPAFRRSSLI